ncbi:hypothetical protein ACHAWF_010823 [Thalassiosira exigua]
MPSHQNFQLKPICCLYPQDVDAPSPPSRGTRSRSSARLRDSPSTDDGGGGEREATSTPRRRSPPPPPPPPREGPQGGGGGGPGNHINKPSTEPSPETANEINLVIDSGGHGSFQIAARTTTNNNAKPAKNGKHAPSSHLTFDIQIDEPSRRYLIHCDMGRLESIRSLHPGMNILRTLSYWNDLQRRRHGPSSGGRLGVVSKGRNSVVAMTLVGEYKRRAWEEDASFRGELERFVEDALQFHLCLNGEGGGGGGSKGGAAGGAMSPGGGGGGGHDEAGGGGGGGGVARGLIRGMTRRNLTGSGGGGGSSAEEDNPGSAVPAAAAGASSPNGSRDAIDASSSSAAAEAPPEDCPASTGGGTAARGRRKLLTKAGSFFSRT